MKSHQRRLREIELSLTPQQIVVVWLKDAVQAGTFAEAARHSPPYRGVIANAVLRTVRNSMKGQSELLIERAIVQARQEADLLYSLAVNANVEVVEKRNRREREYILLLGYLAAEVRGITTKDSLRNFRMAVEMFIEAVLVLEAAITQIANERLNGQVMLFPDCGVKLREQLEMVKQLSEMFNLLARATGAAEIHLEQFQKSLQKEIDHQISAWMSLAQVTVFSLFGSEEQMRAALDQFPSIDGT